MRILLTSATAFVVGVLMLALCGGETTAAPLPAMSDLSVDRSAVETVGWRRRYWRRYGTWPTGPRDAFGDYDGAIDGDAVMVEPIAPGEAIVVAPLRPRSCGEFRYWNGVACVDARYNDPYLGPVE